MRSGLLLRRHHASVVLAGVFARAVVTNADRVWSYCGLWGNGQTQSASLSLHYRRTRGIVLPSLLDGQMTFFLLSITVSLRDIALPIARPSHCVPAAVHRQDCRVSYSLSRNKRLCKQRHVNSQMSPASHPALNLASRALCQPL